MEKLLIINPGSTSTKIAVYEDEKQLFVENITHEAEVIEQYPEIMDQYEFRRDLIYSIVEEKGVNLKDLTAIVSRGGLLPPIEAGAYKINEDMVWQLKNKPQNEHASNLGAVIAYDISQKYEIPSFIYDGVTVDEMSPIMKVTGLPEMRRKGLGHNLNMRAAAMRFARQENKEYKDCTVIVTHLGGGISVSLHTKGRVADIVSDEEGPFSPERSGGLPLFQVIDLATSGKYDKKALMKLVKNKGGFMGYFGTTDTREIEKRMNNGDERARLIYEAMTLNIAKHIAAEAAVTCGQIDAIILTGGIAYSDTFTGMISERVRFIAPVVIYPGENEMESLALGGLRVLRGQEDAKEFRKEV